MEGNSLKTIENLCKIFETRIKLDKEKNIETPHEVINNYEKYAKKIDAAHNEKFEKELKKIITPAATIEKEEARLKKLIELLNRRISEREELENRFYKTTNNYINDLQLIVSENELESKKNRLEAVTKYLDTINEINTINESIDKLKESLSEEVAKEEEYNQKNQIMENELYSNFKEVIDENEYFNTITEDNIKEELIKVKDKVEENKETLDVTKESIDSLKVVGNEEDYSMYIEDAEKNYYLWKNREILLEIYELVSNFKEEFTELYEKRNNLNKLLKQRKNIINSLSYEVNDELSLLEKQAEEDLNTLNREKEVLDNISNYTNRISFKEERLNELNEINNSVEILTILREYGLIDTYDNNEIEEEKIDTIEEQINMIPEETEEENLVNEFYDPYRIIEIKDYPKTLNLGLAKLKGESVREKVNKKLNPEVKEIVIPEPKVIPESEVIPEPIEEVNEIPSRVEQNIPVWEMPEQVKEMPATTEIPQEEPVVWQTPEIEKSSNTPIWYEMNTFQPEPKPSNDSFWIPVDNSKPSEDTFPSINIPINTNNSNNENDLGFPEINN